MASGVIEAAVARLRSRSKTRTEADLQTDISILLVSGDLNLDAEDVVKRESQVGDGTQRRIDVEVGRTIIEVKKDLRVGKVLAEAEVQLGGYVDTRQKELDTRVAGILTDGSSWLLYRMADGSSVENVARLDLTGADEDADKLLAWLESVMATQSQVHPTPGLIAERLGADSPAHRLDYATLRQLLEDAEGNPEVALKRELWAKLLRTAFGSAFTDDTEMFVNHTLLVLIAEAVAHAIIGFDLTGDKVSPEDLVSGALFNRARVFNVVEADFFDWVCEVPGGAGFVADLGRRIARFDWTNVEHDVLKVLYESVIEQADRAALGEYYTPDWLAERMVDDVVTDPLHERVLDPSCGSGTFLFHATRAYLATAEASGLTPGQAAEGASAHVAGLDIHPVAVTLARVTFLLALGRHRINHPDRRQLTAPVFLGDALGWERHHDLFTDEGKITVTTAGDELVTGGGALFGDDLNFPASVWADADRFDRLVADMAAALEGAKTSKSGNDVFRRHGIAEGPDLEMLRVTFDTWRRLHQSGRDHVWGYYVRNLVRPLWLSLTHNRVDVLVGNPPWLRYNKMTSAMQVRYKELSKPRNMLTGGLGASSRDLSTLFVVRAVENYLRDGGRFSFVMPFGTLSRRPHTGFRSGDWTGKGVDSLRVTFDSAWDTSDAPTGFPMTSCVIRGTLTPGQAGPLPAATRKWSARFPNAKSSWADVAGRFTITDSTIATIDAGDDVDTSPYAELFRDGAILYPRMLLMVVERPSGPLSAGAGRVEVESRRSSQEKKPWKDLPGLSGIVETGHVHPVHLGETIAPFRALPPLLAVLPLAPDHILTDNEIDESPDLADWWRGQVEAAWGEGRAKTEKSPLLTRMDYHGQLSAQLPLRPHRVVYSKAGSNLVAARLEDTDSVLDHSLYWAPAASIEEARYLTGILNSDTLLSRVRPYQAVGLFGARHFDKYVFRIPFPAFAPGDPDHRHVAALAARAEEVAARVPVASGTGFKEVRKAISASLKADGVAGELEKAVDVVLPPPSI